MTTILDSATITDAYTDFVLGLRLESIPTEVIEAAKARILDWIGVALAGSSTPQADIVVATMAQALDFDDAIDSCLNPSASNGAGALGIGQWRGSSGAEVLTAFLAGYEVTAQIARKIGRLLQAGGSFFCTGITAPLGVASGASRLIGLSPTAFKNALGLAGTQSAGLRQTLGTMTKPLMSGKAAMNGVLAAVWAEGGYTSSERILDGEHGLAGAFLGESLSGTAENLGRNWEILKSLIKPYPTCGGFPAAIECAMQLHEAGQIPTSEIDRVVVELAPQTVLGAGIARPVGAEAGRLSAQYVVSTVLTHGAIGRDDFTDEAVARSDIQELLKKVELQPINTGVSEGRVRVIGTDGSEVERYVEWAKGSSGNPMTTAEVQSKFMRNAVPVIGQERAATVAEMVTNLERVDAVGDIMTLCA